MLIFLTGIPGAGKTAGLTKFLVEKLSQTGFEDYLKLKREQKKMERGGFVVDLPPQHHLCYSDYTVKYFNLKPYYVDGFQLGMPNPFFKTANIPPYSTIFLDEAQRYYDSRMSKFIREEVYLWYQFHRHNDYTVFLACQRITDIDIKIRTLGQRFICLDEVSVKENEYGMITKCIWKGKEFSSCDCAEKYTMSKDEYKNKDTGKDFEMSCDFNIFNCYNSKSCRPFFYKGKYNVPYDYYSENGYEFTLDSFVEFNDRHLFTAPQGFFKNPERDKIILSKFGGLIQ